MEGGTIGSTEITLTPGQIKGGDYAVDTKTAGYISQFSLLYLSTSTHISCVAQEYNSDYSSYPTMSTFCSQEKHFENQRRNKC